MYQINMRLVLVDPAASLWCENMLLWFKGDLPDGISCGGLGLLDGRLSYFNLRHITPLSCCLSGQEMPVSRSSRYCQTTMRFYAYRQYICCERLFSFSSV